MVRINTKKATTRGLRFILAIVLFHPLSYNQHSPTTSIGWGVLISATWGTAAYGLDADLGFSIDVPAWGDTPNLFPKFDVALGKGPAIKIRDTGMIADPRAMQLTRAGVPVGCVSTPCRYAHAPSEMVDFNDVQTIRLVAALVSNPLEL